MSNSNRVEVPVFAENASFRNPAEVQAEATIILERNEKTAEIFIRTTPGSPLYNFLVADGELKFLTVGGQKVGIPREQVIEINKKKEEAHEQPHIATPGSLNERRGW